MTQIWPFLLLAAPTAQQAPPAMPPSETPAAPAESALDEIADEETDGEDIVVTGSRTPRGSVIGDIKPEVTLNARDIRAYGASNIGELLQELSPLTGSIQGRGEGQPVVLLSGRRISGFREVRDLPPEAIARVEILPEEVALKYGYRPDQKVVNIVLRRRFNAITAEAETTLATDGGRQVYEADVNYLRLADNSRFSIDGEYTRSNPLFETQRAFPGADPDRTLLAASDAAKLDATYNRTILGNISATLSGGLEGQNSLAALGRSSDGTHRLLRDARTRTGTLNYALNGDLAQWRWTLNGGYTRDWSTTLTDRDAAAGTTRDRARSVAETITSEATINGRLFDLPAGAVTTTLKAGVTLRDITGESVRAGVLRPVDLSRDQGSGQANIDVPILRNSPVGALSATINGGIDQLSDFGTLGTFGYGFNWRPSGAIRLIGSVTHEQGAPSIQQLGNPQIATPNVRVLDLTTGQTVDVTVVEGGNAGLRADRRRVLKLGLTAKPIADTNLTLIANYTDSRITDPIASFPTASPEIEAAFRNRFIRDDAGTLIQIDNRAVNFTSSRQRQIRWGVNWSETLEAPPPTGPDGQPLTPEQIEERRAAFREARRAGNAPGASASGVREPGAGRGFGRGGFGGGGGGFGGRGARQGRIQLSAFHTWRLEDTILVRPGVPELDLLGGSAIGSRGGRPRHEIEFNAGYNRNGLGVRLSGNWVSGTTLNADPSGAPSPQDLAFGSLFTSNLRVFADLGQQRALVRKAPFFRGARVTLSVNNLFNQRLDVRDTLGITPIGYNPSLLDPLGRSVRLSFRKLFF
ncbi:TonB-dependent receptor plug domain-containing protein [Sphingomonas sp. NBWT7]|uniref:TonB-dependent receptor plug domain-containing protein n=1 Tax=Sphingomonas sp. NBWT7 TaxID=2596913 RepID=UPI0016279FD6|nr:TonB-dependent receptor [Sphingomonas sp. NBWT7]QNE32193.1 TonB-dependent receptor plug domain-containing protein [Sphingomonas sp. NBWT7]